MKTVSPLLLLLAALAISFPVRAQDPGAEVLASVKELKSQQAQIADNESKIEAKVIDLAEAIRAARIYMSRAGGAHKPPP